MRVKKKNWTTPTLLLSTVASMMLQWGGDDEEEVAAEDDRGDDAFGDVIHDAQRECESEKEKNMFACIPEDHRKSQYPAAEEGQKKAGYHTRIATMEGKEWYI